ncbi:MAG: YybH family protein [Anaerolineales bacterium]
MGSSDLNNVILAFSVLVLPACAPAGEEMAPTTEEIAAQEADDIEAINQLRSDYAEAYNAQDAARLAGYHVADAVVSLPNEPPITGRESIQADLQQTFDQFQTEITISSNEMQVAGDWAFDAGTTVQKWTPKEEGEAMEIHGSFIVILKRDADGSWKLAWLVASSDDPLPGAGEATQ